MRLLIASDLHGSEVTCQKLLERFALEGADKLLFLGDILYHGPRNDLPEGYRPKGVIAQLNAVKEKLICVRGNCEAEVDQMVLEFPVMADLLLLELDGVTFYATHGHITNEDNLPPLAPGSVLLNGHTHLHALVAREGYTYVNPGSVTLPKGGNERTYVVYENRRFTLKTLEGEVLETLELVQNR